MVEWKKLGDIMQIVRGASPRPIKNYITSEINGVNWIKIGDVEPGAKYITCSNEKITKGGAEKSRYLHAGDFILSNSMSFGRPYILKIDGCIHDGWIAMSDYEKSVSSGYLYEILNSNFVQDYWKQKANNGGAMSNLNSDIVKATIIPVPSLSEQERIVGILDTFTASIENLKEQITQRRKQYEYYRDQLLDLEGKEGVEMKMLGDFCDTLSGFPFDSSQFRDEGIQLMRGANIKRGYFDFSQELNKYWISSEGLEKYLLEPNDIIISMDGSLVGRSFCYLRSDHLPLLLVQRVARIRTKENYKYVYYNITKSFPDYVDKKKTAGAIPHISMKDINSFIIPVPPLSEQQRIVDILDKFEASIQNLESQLSQREKQYEYYRNKLLTFED